MIEIRIHGRGGQGGVTLAKIIATVRFLQGESVQAFGKYAAERSGAPLQAYCRYDTEPITIRNEIYEPDHVIVVDPTLVGPAITSGLASRGWILINTAAPPSELRDRFPHFRLATVDATSIARDNKIGTRSVPIVNTALAGATARVLGFELDQVHAALEDLGFVGGNLTAADQAFERTRISEVEPVPESPEEFEARKPKPSTARFPTIIDGAVGLARVKTGNWATQQPRRQLQTPPCNHVCPAGNDVQGFLQALAREEVDEALGILLETTPLPSVCGRVCPAPCMEACNRLHLDGSVNIRDLERYAGDHGRATIEPAADRPEKVAVVGSGPAGLSAAYQLRRHGYQVTVHEGGPELGGLLRTGIPAYRLPPEVLDRELARIRDLGVKFVTEHRVDRQGLLDLARSHDAVLVATGLQELRALRLGTGDAEAVVQGIDFLDDAWQGKVRVDGEDVVVVGGGNTAMDAARSALRLGASSVRVVYRRTRVEMPAIKEEIDHALEEGIAIDFLTLPVGIKPTNGHYQLTCRRMEMGAPDESGRRRPVEIPDSDFDLACHRVILALGQSADLKIFPEGTEVKEDNQLLGLIERPVYAIGDLATWEGTVTAAIGSGRRSAGHIHELLSGEKLPADHLADLYDLDRRDHVVTSEEMKMHLFERQPEDVGETVAPAERTHGFGEVHHGIASPEEAKRCLSCGVCNECDLCVTYCPDGVLVRDGHKFVFDYDFCKGCGICASECPRNVVVMSQL